MRFRLLHSDNSTLKDLSTDIEKYHSGSASVTYTTSEDKIYLGSRFPFSSFYIEMSDTVNLLGGAMSIKYWNGTAFRDTVEIIDRTDALSNSGYVDFTPNHDWTWNREHTNHNGETVTGLEDVNIYDLYWLEISFDTTLTGNTEIKYIGQKFCEDEDLEAIYPALNRSDVKSSFKTGKTNWNEQSVAASNEILDRIKKEYLVESGNLLLNREDYKTACVEKLASIIFTSFGDDYEDDRIQSGKNYNYHFKLARPVLDNNKNAIEDVRESIARQGYMTR